ncbi:hypothetical protein Tco_1064938 [Tanacetum coccineum]
MLASQVVEGEGSGQPFEPQHIPTTASPSHVVLIPTVASSSHPKKTHKHRKTKRQTTEISQSSGPTTLVADETVHGERGDGVERAATTAASLDAKQDSDTILGDKHAQTRFERLSKQSNDPPLSRVNTLRSGEDNMKLNGLIEICIRLSERVLALENIKTAHNFEIINLKKRVKKLEKKKKEDASKQGRNIIDQDEEISWFQEDPKTQGRYGHDFEVNTASTSITTASINITTAEPVTTANAPVTTVGVSVSTAEPKKSKEKGVSSETTIRPTRGVIMKEASETVTRPIVPPQQQLDPKDKGKGIMQELEKPVKVKGKDQIAFDEEVARRLEAHLQAEYEEEERVARQREEEDNLIS